MSLLFSLEFSRLIPSQEEVFSSFEEISLRRNDLVKKHYLVNSQTSKNFSVVLFGNIYFAIVEYQKYLQHLDNNYCLFQEDIDRVHQLAINDISSTIEEIFEIQLNSPSLNLREAIVLFFVDKIVDYYLNSVFLETKIVSP
jgi:hypothetical protein